MINTAKPEPSSGNLENNEDIKQSSNNSQNSLSGPIYEPETADTEEPGTVYPQKWATGDGTANNPWANDCIQKALDFVPVGGTIFLKAGYYTLSDQAEITKKVNIIGEGRDKTIITTADAHGFYIESVDYVTIKNLTIDGDAQTTDGTTYLTCITIGRSDYILLEKIEVKNAARYGIFMHMIIIDTVCIQVLMYREIICIILIEIFMLGIMELVVLMIGVMTKLAQTKTYITYITTCNAGIMGKQVFRYVVKGVGLYLIHL
jgi:hypothetical protein